MIESAGPSIPDGVDLSCPMCGYDLRGLEAPRCPECGREFEWADFTDADRRRHRYLFEHHPRHNVWSFVRTWLAGWRPVRFWRGINASSEISVRRLVLYWMICGLASVGLYILLRADYGVWLWKFMTGPRGWRYYTPYFYSPPPASFVEPLQSPEYWLRVVLPIADQEYRPVITALLLNTAVFLVPLWPWMTLMTFGLVGTTMRAAKIRQAQLIRMTIYACDGAAIVPLLLGCVLSILAIEQFSGAFISRTFHVWLAQTWRDHGEPLIGYLPLVFVILFTVRLAIAARIYLGIRHAVSMVIATQLIIWLFLAVVAFFFYGAQIMLYYT